MSDYLAPLTAILLPHVGAVAGEIITKRNLDSWHEGLKYPSWSPHKKVYHVVWTTLYTSMGYASYLVWRDGSGLGGTAAYPLALYGTQLALSWAWTPAFYHFRSPQLAFVNGLLLWGAVAGTIYAFRDVNEKAAYLLLPYLGWVTYSAVLSFKIWRDNQEKKKE